MDWIFPISRPPPLDAAERPQLPVLRALARNALHALASRVQQGAPVLVVDPPPAPLAGWSHWHPHEELFVQLAGASRFATPAGSIRLAADGCVLFPAFSPHDERIDTAKGAFANLVIVPHPAGGFGYHLALAATAGSDAPRIFHPDHVGGDGFGAACLAQAARAAGERAGQVHQATVAAFALWAAEALAAQPEEPGERAAQVETLLHAHLSYPELSVARIAGWLGCHPDHLTRAFRRRTGTTIAARLAEVRLEHATRQLADPRLRVQDVARLCGFTDPAYFSRAFRRRHGMTPQAWRERSGGAAAS